MVAGIAHSIMCRHKLLKANKKLERFCALELNARALEEEVRQASEN
jgi:hypothetical protein